MEFIRNVKTPTLVLHGERDSEVPTPQGYEFWHALKTLAVTTQLVIYPDEGHDIRQPGHRLDILKRTVAWFDKYLR
jgi:dipeptidyl aminopeptidase/acylaminoacyl peptidase